MDRSNLRAIVSAHVPEMAKFLGLDDWRIFSKYERLNDNDAARIAVEIDYKQAVISIDMDHFDEDTEVVDILFHELAHIVLSPFDVYREIMGQFVPDITDSQPNGKVESRTWKHACEGGVLALEKVWRAHLRDVYLAEFTAPDLTNNQEAPHA